MIKPVIDAIVFYFPPVRALCEALFSDAVAHGVLALGHLLAMLHHILR